jgi:hypothetical protein
MLRDDETEHMKCLEAGAESGSDDTDTPSYCPDSESAGGSE